MSRRWLTFALCLCFLSFGNVNCVKPSIPSWVKQCNRHEPKEEVRKCIEENIIIFKPRFGAGIPELRIPPLDPLYIERINLDLPHFHSEFINITVFGGSNFEIKQFDFDIDNNFMSFDLLFPSVHMEAKYRVKGKLLIDLNSKGSTWTNVTNTMVHVEIRGDVQERKDKHYLNFNDKTKNILKLNITENPITYFDNLFENNEELTKTTNLILNNNMSELIKELLPVVEEVVEAFVINTIKQIFNTFALEELFIS